MEYSLLSPWSLSFRLKGLYGNIYPNMSYFHWSILSTIGQLFCWLILFGKALRIMGSVFIKKRIVKFSTIALIKCKPWSLTSEWASKFHQCEWGSKFGKDEFMDEFCCDYCCNCSKCFNFHPFGNMVGNYQDVFIFNISTNRLDGANKIQPPLHEGFKDRLIFL